MKKNKDNINRLCLVEVTDLALEQLKGKEGVAIPVFTKMKPFDWFIAIERLAPRSQRQI